VNRSFSGHNVLFGLAAVFYLFMTVMFFRNASAMPDATASYALGYAIIGPATLALLVRGIYVGARWHWSRVAFFSGWLLVLAAAFALLGNVSLNSQPSQSVTVEQPADEAVTPMMVVNSWVGNGQVVLATWCAEVTGYEDVAFAAFKKEYGTGEPSAEALWNELIRRC
jgi:hypothetical protein